jgi:polysaccharide chain length determinant protein (PEP-CTERM system associated)
MSGGAISARGSSTDGQIATLEQRRAELLINYTEKHPEVVRIDQQLEVLRAKRAAEGASKNPDDMPIISNPLDINPVYQSLKIQRSKVEVELASLRAQLADKQARVDRLKKMVDVIPQVEAELNRLNRDYDVVKARYGQMLQRWEDLQTGKRVKTGTDQVQFRIVNPPFAPIDPAGPPRTLYILLATIGALGAGLAVAFLLNILRPVFHQSRDLVDYGVPILGSITMNDTGDVQDRGRFATMLLVGGGVALMVSTVLVIAFARTASEFLRSIT